MTHGVPCTTAALQDVPIDHSQDSHLAHAQFFGCLVQIELAALRALAVTIHRDTVIGSKSPDPCFVHAVLGRTL
jgi:hypothetical protein